MALVAIVGRPNVGKSTLFNRLVGMRQAIVDETAGVTRDRHYGKCEWCGREFSVVDTGGYTSNSDDVFEDAIRRQVVIAIEEADVVLFLCEAATGITDYDRYIKIYPNPAGDVINVECTMNNVQLGGEIEVVDVYGKTVHAVVGANNDSPLRTRIDVSGLAAGVYFVRVTTDEGVVTKAFVKN